MVFSQIFPFFSRIEIAQRHDYGKNRSDHPWARRFTEGSEYFDTMPITGRLQTRVKAGRAWKVKEMVQGGAPERARSAEDISQPQR
jgi:hypothetical protein